MRKLFLLFACNVIFCSCAITNTYYYTQVLKTEPIDKKNMTAINGGITYEDENCMVFYSFWSEHGNVNFSIFNKTNEIIYIDMTKSFFIKDGVAYDYFKDRTLESSESKASIYSTSLSYATSIGGASVSAKEQPILAIPPKASKQVSEYDISSSLILDCDLKRFPTDSASMTFTPDDSPLKYSNYLTYRVGEGASKVIDNQFYVAKVTNYANPLLREFVLRENKPCQNITLDTSEDYNQNYPIHVYDIIYKIDNTNCFYIPYSITSNREFYPQKDNKNLKYSETYDGYINADIEDGKLYKFIGGRLYMIK